MNILKSKTKSAWYDGAIKACLYALIVLIPAVFSPAFYTVFSLPKATILRIFTIAIIILWGCKIFVEAKFSYQKSLLNILLLIYGIISIITTIGSTVFYTSFFGAQGHFIGIFTALDFLFLTFVAFNYIRDLKEIKKIILISFYTASALAIYGIFQYFGLGQDGFNWSQNPAERVFGTIGHGNHFGAYLGMNILLALFIIPLIKNKKNRWLLIGGTILQILVLFLTASRGAIFATVSTVIFCSIFLFRRNYKNHQFKTKKLFAGLLIFLILAIGSSIVFWPQLSKIQAVERTMQTVDFIKAGNVPDRISWWLSAFEMIKQRPLFGFGLASFHDVYNQYRRADYKAQDDSQFLTTPESAHNDYLDIAVNQGLIGLISYLAIIVFLFYIVDKIIYNPKSGNENYHITLALKGALMVYLIQAFFNFGVIATLSIFYILMGMTANLNITKNIKTIKIPNPLRYFLVILLATGITYYSSFTFKEAAAEYYLKNAESSTMQNNLGNKIINYQSAVNQEPLMYEYRQFIADFALKNSSDADLKPSSQLKMLELAMANYQFAIKINANHPSVFYNLALANLQSYLATTNQVFYKNAVSSFQKSVEKSPNNPLYAYMAGKALIDLPEASKQVITFLEQARKIQPDYKDTVELIAKLQETNGK